MEKCNKVVFNFIRVKKRLNDSHFQKAWIWMECTLNAIIHANSTAKRSNILALRFARSSHSLVREYSQRNKRNCSSLRISWIFNNKIWNMWKENNLACSTRHSTWELFLCLFRSVTSTYGKLWYTNFTMSYLIFRETREQQKFPNLFTFCKISTVVFICLLRI